MNRTLILCVLHALLCVAASAQEERPVVADTTDDEVRFGEFAEGDDSPLGEILAPEPAAPPHVEIRSRFVARADVPDGFRDGTYEGSPLKSYQRLRLAPFAHLSGGLLLEKDPGERKIDDFMTGYIVLRGLGALRTFVLGDYIVESGLGLSLWRGVDVGKGEDIAGAIMRNERGIVPHSSSDENTFFRGAAAGLQLGGWSVNLLVSHRRVDASVDANGAATGIYTSGYFRTAGEEAKRGTLGERFVGLTAHAGDARGNRFGVCLYRSLYARTLTLDGGERFSERNTGMASFDYLLHAGPWSLFGEWAVAQRVPGGSSGALLRAAPGVELVAAARYYPYGFVSLHGNGFGEHGGMANERGFYGGVRVNVARRWTVAAYADLFRFPGGTPSQHFASGGSDRFLQLELQAAPRCALALRCAGKETLEESAIRDAAGLAAASPVSSLRRSLRLTIDYRTAGGLKVRARWEGAFLPTDSAGGAGRGILVLTELTAPAARFWWNVRVVLFRTTSYEARLYAYERDLDGVTAMPALYGEGFRWSCVFRYAVSRALACSLKCSEEVRDDVRRIGTGPDRLPGNEDARAGVQIDLAL